MKAVVAAFNQEKALVGAFSVITNLRMELFEALKDTRRHKHLHHHHLGGGVVVAAGKGDGDREGLEEEGGLEVS